MRRCCVGIVIVLWCLSVVGSGCGRSKTESGNGSSYSSSLPVIKRAPDFGGVRPSGQEFSSTALRGSVWIASFMFTTCQGVCPAMNDNLRQLVRKPGMNELKVVSMTVDPEYDSPAVLGEYAQQFGVPDSTWFFIWMRKDSVRKTSVEGFLLADPIEPSAHSPRYALVDRSNNIRGYYDSMDSADVAHLARDAADLLKEKVH